jgi:4-amino-4-deoxy-L-arabinose transferase-like glycosyltransferase
MLMKLSYRQSQLLIVFLSALLFIPFLGQVHLFDWDEINFAESAREMLITGNWLEVQVDFETFWEKPPLFIWMQAISMKIFGINEFAARFPNAICGILSLLVLFHIGNRLYNRQYAWIWVLVYVGSFLPFFYFKSGIIDPWFNLFIFLGIYYLFRYLTLRNLWFVSLGAMFTGLAVLTKGPVGALIVGLSMLAYLFIIRFKVKIKFQDILLFLLVFSLFGGLWFILMLLNGNSEMIVDFVAYQIRLFQTEDAGHGGFLFYHFVVLLFGVFPASIFALKGFRFTKAKSERANFKRLMQVLFFVVLILFTIVKTKIVHYSSMAYFPMTYLAAYVILNIVNRNYKLSRWMKVSITALGTFYALLLIILSNFDSLKSRLINTGAFDDPFAEAAIQANAGWTGFEILPGIILLAAVITFLIFAIQKRRMHAIVSLFVGSLLFVQLSMILIVPRIERYSQHAAIEFYKAHAGEDVYMRPVGFKSYAHLFYFQKTVQKHPSHNNEFWLMAGDIDKHAYFVIKIQHLEKYLKKYPEVTEIYRKNGFVFCEREKKN